TYMSLVPIIQPPIMRWLTTEKERKIKMEQLKPVSQKVKIIFPIAVNIVCILLLPSAAPLIGMLMLGNLFRECGVTKRLHETSETHLINVVTILLALAVGSSMTADTFLTVETIKIICLGLFAFATATAGGVLLGKLMSVMTGGKVNPLIGSAGVSAVPMAARVSQNVGREADPHNFLLMHAMGPNVAGVIGTAVAAGVFMALFAEGDMQMIPGHTQLIIERGADMLRSLLGMA
ncbi:MAG: sodium ion-translocating decarboxylase subunit beta, partial [Nitrospinae bacterium]|nr:sodium ion-translocating decarboxylase subunit beta [Nitrospinota bacterium]